MLMLRRLVYSLALTIAAATVPTFALAGTLDVTNLPLTDVVAMLSGQLHESIILGPKLDKTMISVHLADMKPAQILTAIETGYGLREVKGQGYVVLVSATDTSETLFQPSYFATVTVPANSAPIVQTFVKTTFPTISASMIDPRRVILAGDQATVVTAEKAIASFSGSEYQEIPVTFAKPSDVLQYLKTSNFVDQTMSVAANDGAGTITVQGTSSQIATVASAIKHYDVKPRRAEFQVSILEVEPNNDSSQTGIQWGTAINNTTSSTSTSGGTTNSNQVTLNPGQAITTFINKSIPLAAQIDAMVTTGSAHILSVQSISFNSTSPSGFNFTTSFPITVSTGSAFTSGNVEYKDIGVVLKLEGVIGEHGEVTTALDATDSTIDSFVQPFNNPVIGKREVNSTITVYPDESLVLSGFESEQDSDSISKVPMLGNIPVIGQLFRDRQTSHQKLQLIFVLRPMTVRQHEGALE
jgi:type II secretory pathway component GspD/PulD (secretin)